jgi:hypothetical protein
MSSKSKARQVIARPVARRCDPNVCRRAARIRVDLVLDGGGVVILSVPLSASNEAAESLDDAIRQRDPWKVSLVKGCRASYNGQNLDFVNMGRVIGLNAYPDDAE